MVSAATDVWCGISDVMAEVGANIEIASGTVMPGPTTTTGAPGDSEDVPPFFVSAFNTHIVPFADPDAAIPVDCKSKTFPLAVSIFLKASVCEGSVAAMSDRLHTRFPCLACTVTVGGSTEHGGDGELTLGRTGTILLFGIDASGQLARISEVLHQCGVTILNLQVTTGTVDAETCEFIELRGGNISENLISFAFLDEAKRDEARLRREMATATREVGYHVASIIMDNDVFSAQELAYYHLKRKAFLGKRPHLDKKS